MIQGFCGDCCGRSRMDRTKNTQGQAFAMFCIMVSLC